ncbi:MAG: phosphatase PAP2 family protein [Oscillospiraceae bacterium]
MEFITALDTEILWLIQSVPHGSGLDSLMIFLSRIGDGGAVWIALTAVLLISKKNRRIGMAMAMAMLLCFLVGNLGIKPWVARLRPYQVDLSISLLIPPPAEFSFPSGHTMNAFAATTALGCSSRRWGGYALLLAALIAFSRLYLMVHYPTDVIAGVLIGVAGGIAAHALVERFVPVSSPHQR